MRPSLFNNHMSTNNELNQPIKKQQAKIILGLDGWMAGKAKKEIWFVKITNHSKGRRFRKNFSYY